MTSGRIDHAALAIAAPPDTLYAAFADPAQLVQWLPPGSMTGRVLVYDFRVGGRYRIELAYAVDNAAGKTTQHSDISAGTFLALEPGRRIVQSVEFESTDAAFAGEMRMTWTLAPTATGTLVTVIAESPPPGIRQADHETGLRESLANLARFVQ